MQAQEQLQCKLRCAGVIVMQTCNVVVFPIATCRLYLAPWGTEQQVQDRPLKVPLMNAFLFSRHNRHEAQGSAGPVNYRSHCRASQCVHDLLHTFCM